MGLGYFIRIRARDDRVLAPIPEEKRVLARVVLNQGRETHLLAFGLADNHLHIEAACNRVVAGELARRIELSLGRRLNVDAGFQPARVDPIKDGRHLYNAFKYALGQDRRHDLDNDPLREASILPDLLGLRVLGRYAAADVRRWLPRIKRRDLLECCGIPELVPLDGPVELVVDAALAAAALPDLSGSSNETTRARRAVIEVIGRRLPTRELAQRLLVSERRVYDLKSAGPADGMLVMAIQLQLGLRQQLGEGVLKNNALPFVPSS